MYSACTTIMQNLSNIWASNRGAILIASLLSGLVMWLLTWLGWGLYTSRALLSTGIVEEVVRTAEPRDSSGISQRFIDDRFTNLISLVHSEQVIHLLAYRLILHDMNMPEPFQPVESLHAYYGDEIWTAARGYYKMLLDSAALPRHQDDLVFLQIQTDMGYDFPSLLRKIKINRVPGTQFIQIRCESPQASQSAFITNVLCQEFIRYHTLMEQAKSKSSVIQLEKLAARKRKELDQKMWELKSYKRSKRQGNRVRQILVHPTRRQRGGEGDPAVDALVQEVSQALEEYLQVLNKLNTASFVSMKPESRIRQVEYGTPASFPQLFPSVLFALLGGIIGFSASTFYWWRKLQM